MASSDRSKILIEPLIDSHNLIEFDPLIGVEQDLLLDCLECIKCIDRMGPMRTDDRAEIRKSFFGDKIETRFFVPSRIFFLNFYPLGMFLPLLFALKIDES